MGQLKTLAVSSTEPQTTQNAAFRLDRINQCAFLGGQSVALSPKAFAVLSYLEKHAGALVTKQELLDAVWPEVNVTEGVLKRAVLEIRKALGDPVEEPRFIQTLHRRGYRFVSPACQAASKAVTPIRQKTLVGREPELSMLDQCWEQALEGLRQILFITGEAGLGKTTLVNYWMQKFEGREGAATTMRGQCLPQFGEGEAYRPVLEALDQLSRTMGRRLVEVLRAYAPAWLVNLPGLISLEERINLRAAVSDPAPEHMVREIVAALEVLAAETPVILELEDMQWSDPSTIHLLTAIANRTSPARLMVVCTSRPSESGPADSPLRSAHNEMELHGTCTMMPLPQLSEVDTCEYLVTRLPGAGRELSRAMHQRSGGNPLYLSCLADEIERSGVDAFDPNAVRTLLPERLQRMFERQTAGRNGVDQVLLDTAAASDEVFSAAELAMALGDNEEDVERRCEALVGQQAMMTRQTPLRFPDGSESMRYSFTTALCRDALYRRTPMFRRARIHAKLAQGMERLYASDPGRVAAELGRHFECAGDVARAVHYFHLAAVEPSARNSRVDSERLRTSPQPARRLKLVEHAENENPASFRQELAVAAVA
jgi:DNA-binding winged helix-turn-helix (wHTH) protein